MVRRLNIDGDGQGDLAGHGGEMRAVLVYQFQALLDQSGVDTSGAAGNAGLTAAAGPPPAWSGFRRLSVTAIDRESDSLFSLRLADPAGAPLPAALPCPASS
jgi:hypothetical protein